VWCGLEGLQLICLRRPLEPALEQLETRYFSFDDLKPEQSWKLLDWCMEHGADEFTISALVVEKESERIKAFLESLARFSLASAPRRLLSGPTREQLTRPVERWQLNTETISLLQQALPMGFASREYEEDLWVEDLAVYRVGDFMMGVLSHEGGGVLRLTTPELQELRATGFPDRDEVACVGF
jgi:hypothetical protein